MYKHWPSRKDRVSLVADLVHRITGLRYIREFFLCSGKVLCSPALGPRLVANQAPQTDAVIKS